MKQVYLYLVMFIVIFFIYNYYYSYVNIREPLSNTYKGCSEVTGSSDPTCQNCLSAYIIDVGPNACYWKEANPKKKKAAMCGSFPDPGFSKTCSAGGGGSGGGGDNSGGGGGGGQESNGEILTDIQNLQKIEQDLFNSLDNPQIQPADSTKIISKINDVSQMRINLYKLLNNLNSNYKNSLTNSREVLSEQSVAIDIVETELNRAKKRLEVLEEEKNNKIRLIEINTYYGQSYDEHTNMMKLIIYILIPIIILAGLFKYEYIPSSIYGILNVIILIIGLVLFWKNYSKIYMHDKLNYPEYEWTFDPSAAPAPDATASNVNPWPTMLKSCLNDQCCPNGYIYDSVQNKCILTTATSTTTGTESFLNMDTLNEIFTKHTREFKKPDVTMNSKIYPKNY